VLKRLLSAEGIETSTPREALQRALQAGWLMDETLWLQMLRDRNETSHVYDEALAKKIYKHIKNYFPEMKSVFRLLAERIKKNHSRRN
jgi:nucleotidyltransferase substrate binding protein (TIGR01987 family)